MASDEKKVRRELRRPRRFFANQSLVRHWLECENKKYGSFPWVAPILGIAMGLFLLVIGTGLFNVTIQYVTPWVSQLLGWLWFGFAIGMPIVVILTAKDRLLSQFVNRMLAGHYERICANCGYTLHPPSVESCPECGTTVTDNAKDFRR